MGHLTHRVQRRWGRPAASSGLVVVMLIAAAVAAHAEEEPVAWGYSIAHELMSPFCPGRTLSQCTSPQAAELRQWIVLQAAAGASREEVEAQLLERFGPSILQAPKAEGWGLSAYAIPILFFVVGGVLVVALLKRLVRPAASERIAASGPAPGEAVDPELARLVDSELEQG